MPHIILEYSSNVQEKKSFDILFSQFHQIFVTIGSVEEINCKSRAMKCDVFCIGDGNSKNGFIHAEIRFLEGWSIDMIQTMGIGILKILQKHFSKSLQELNLQISVEFITFPSNLYFKVSS
jgi:5-carboxymethyl-2-hydroxymuconate isomerase